MPTSTPELVTLAVFVLLAIGAVGVFKKISGGSALLMKLVGARPIATAGELKPSFSRTRDVRLARALLGSGSHNIGVVATIKQSEPLTMIDATQTMGTTTHQSALFFDEITTREFAAVMRSALDHLSGVAETMILVAARRTVHGLDVVGEVGCVTPRFVEAPEPRNRRRTYNRAVRDCCVLLLKGSNEYEIGIDFGHRGILPVVLNESETMAFAELLTIAADCLTQIRDHPSPPTPPARYE